MDRILKSYQTIAEGLFRITGGSIGYLVPGLDSGMKVERTLIRSAEGMDLYRPFGWAQFDMETGALLFYKHCITEDFIDTERYPLDTLMSRSFVSTRSVDQQTAYEEELWETYLKLRVFVFSEELTDAQKAIMREYRQLWKQTLLQDLAVYYEAVSPEFFEWLAKA